ncbi:MAG: protein-L-isoaspartate O-methyltransferase [Pseudomonadota bacterium]|nr:protein-L-isoaspartate O-methyltransferase [Pseudomonadota bacterium]
MNSKTPEFDHAAARRAMIDSQLRPQGVTDPLVIAAMAAVPRERFVPPEARAIAYSDRSIPLGEGRAMAPPAALGALLNALLPEEGERALVIGAGPGYSAAVLAAMGVTVTALDTAESASATRGGFDRVTGPLAAGHAKGAPYDIILIDGAVEYIPDALVAQLGEGGRLGAALIENGIVRLILGTRSGSAFGHRSIGDAGVPPLPGFARPREFTF